MSSGDSMAAMPMIGDMRATIPHDKRASIEVAYVRPLPVRWAPPPPRPSLKLIAAWLIFAAGAIAFLYMSARPGPQEQPHASTAR